MEPPQITEVPCTSENPPDLSRTREVTLTPLSDEQINHGNQFNLSALISSYQMTINLDSIDLDDLDETRRSALERILLLLFCLRFDNTSTRQTHETSTEIEHSHANVLSTIQTEPLDTYEETIETAVSNVFDTFQERFNCSMCYKDFFDNESFVIHKYTEHNAHRFKPYMCHVCNEKFLLSAHLDFHMSKHVDARRQSSTFATYPSSESNLTNKDDLKKSSKKSKHVNHAKLKPFKCPNCIFASESETEFMEHQLTCSTIDEQTCTTFPDNCSAPDCYLCGKTFMDQTALNKHMLYHSLRGEIVSRRQHHALNIGNLENIQHCFDNSEKSPNTRKTDDASKMYKCKVCTRVFISRRKRFIHYQQHKKQMLCNICDKQFFFYKSYQKHLLKHETDNQINYNNRSTLLDNQKVSEYKSVPNTNRFKVEIINCKSPNYMEPQKPFQCMQCKNCYSSKGSLAGHIRLYHKLGKKKCTPKLASTPCNWCQKIITTNNLHRHVKTCHPTVKLLSCILCTSKFRDCSSLRLHISEFHHRLY